MTTQHLTRFLIAGLYSVALHAATVSLSGNFSINNGNPNGQWKYTDNATLLTLQSPQNNGNALIPALASGYWGAGDNLNANTPELFKSLVNGINAGGNNGDFVVGDIVGHSPNDGTTLYATWTAPSAGTISSIDLAVWYAHSSVSRSNDYALFYNASQLASGTVSSSAFQNRTSAATYTNNAGFSVAQGDTIALGLTKTSGQSFGSLAGMALNFDFTPVAVSDVPEPSTAALLTLGVAGLGLVRRRYC